MQFPPPVFSGFQNDSSWGFLLRLRETFHFSLWFVVAHTRQGEQNFFWPQACEPKLVCFNSKLGQIAFLLLFNSDQNEFSTSIFKK